MGSKFVQRAAVLLLLSSLSVAARFTEQLTVAGGGCKEAFFAQLGHSFRYQAYISSASDLVGCIRSVLQWTRESVVRTLPSSNLLSISAGCRSYLFMETASRAEATILGYN